MQLKNYADTDFFLALIKDSDWLKEKAKKLYQQHKENLWIAPFTIVELMIICQREKIPLKRTLFNISRIAKLEVLSWNYFFKACNYMESGATIFNSLLMAFSEENNIISSDKIYEKFGFNVISLND